MPLNVCRHATQGFLIFNVACMAYTFGFGVTFLVWGDPLLCSVTRLHSYCIPFSGWRVRSSLSAFADKLAQSEPVPEKLSLPGVT